MPEMEPAQLSARPVQATQHPFVYCSEGFRVRVRIGSKETLHLRMDCKDLLAHLSTGTSPTGSEKGDASFYAAQLVHYGLPEDKCKQRAIHTLSGVFTTRNGSPVLQVPVQMTSIARKLKKEYEVLLLLADAEAKYKAQKTALVQHEAQSLQLVKSMKDCEEQVLEYQRKLQSFKRDLADQKEKGEGLVANTTALKEQVAIYRQQLKACKANHLIVSAEQVKEEASDPAAIQVDISVPAPSSPSTQGANAKRSLPAEAATPSTAANNVKRAKLYPSSAPPQARMLDLVQSVTPSLANSASSPSGSTDARTAASSSRPDSSRLSSEYGTPARSTRRESNVRETLVLELESFAFISWASY